ncbi:putative CCR4-NOT transcription complex, subunit 7 [Monocercomonoides exilis]|uniref:putative CCR4-NOT transcription complex, subunit 7 n=1 Tax=Monocercomonoides exilis TaxID=2049356 RepID=UPI003559CBC8|nr:putative CCR4-NOT transcription complex, subunit 7 [Monocercomonoides exilis]|eukprot:MONOS_4925.1-p1 / transcript=MONOS_4925.1 / gene=MONOS_4925 / organism=Monocercomonoides_exilis_PA203 / gene_product=ccr4associated factor, putative / transcript_product=ccr4associated factor, putative / location=Mono_scaffold00138:11092-13886(+) / protein_length=868 / sequence_SO=supercontig / SO=protein_coding / is_pseudo=false
MDQVNRQDRMFVEVWANNMQEEMERISEILPEYPYVSMDTEFPGEVVFPQSSSHADYQYDKIKSNVDQLKLIQLGLTFSKDNGELPPETTTWQFNFRFDVNTDKSAITSINLLTNAGIEWNRFSTEGIDQHEFAQALTTSGLVMNPDVTWVTFHSSYDFGYLMKLLTCRPLPMYHCDFMALLDAYFPRIYDLKILSRTSRGLSALANDYSVERVGITHQAGSDSLLTCELFFKIVRKWYNNQVDEKLYNHQIAGLGGEKLLRQPGFEEFPAPPREEREDANEPSFVRMMSMQMGMPMGFGMRMRPSTDSSSMNVGSAASAGITSSSTYSTSPSPTTLNSSQSHSPSFSLTGSSTSQAQQMMTSMQQSVVSSSLIGASRNIPYGGVDSIFGTQVTYDRLGRPIRSVEIGVDEGIGSASERREISNIHNTEASHLESIQQDLLENMRNRGHLYREMEMNPIDKPAMSSTDDLNWKMRLRRRGMAANVDRFGEGEGDLGVVIGDEQGMERSLRGEGGVGNMQLGSGRVFDEGNLGEYEMNDPDLEKELMPRDGGAGRAIGNGNDQRVGIDGIGAFRSAGYQLSQQDRRHRFQSRIVAPQQQQQRDQRQQDHLGYHSNYRRRYLTRTQLPSNIGAFNADDGTEEDDDVQGNEGGYNQRFSSVMMNGPDYLEPGSNSNDNSFSLTDRAEYGSSTSMMTGMSTIHSPSTAIGSEETYFSPGAVPFIPAVQRTSGYPSNYVNSSSNEYQSQSHSPSLLPSISLFSPSVSPLNYAPSSPSPSPPSTSPVSAVPTFQCFPTAPVAATASAPLNDGVVSSSSSSQTTSQQTTQLISIAASASSPAGTPSRLLASQQNPLSSTLSVPSSLRTFAPTSNS